MSGDPTPQSGDPTLRHPGPGDGPVLHRLAEVAGGLDVNTRYAYVLWARDFAATTVVAALGGTDVGCITGYRRPDAPDTLFIWQVAVAPEARRRGLAGTMADWLVAGHVEGGGRFLEATVTPSNTASRRLFTGVGERRGAEVAWSPLFGGDVLGSGHEPEELVRIGPFD